MKRFSVRMLVMLGLLVALPAQAQVYKCKNPAGRIEYQQKPCSGQGTMISTQEQSAPAVQAGPPGRVAPPAENPDARYLRSLIAGYIAQGDYQHAESLAVTAEHHAMIRDAKRMEAEAKNRERASRPPLTIVMPAHQPYQPPPLAPSQSLRCKKNYLGGMDCEPN